MHSAFQIFISELVCSKSQSYPFLSLYIRFLARHRDNISTEHKQPVSMQTRNRVTVSTIYDIFAIREELYDHFY